MSERPARLSILLPTHDRADVLPYAVESVLGQSFTDFELLIVGDGCTDRTADVVADYCRQDRRVRWFDLPKAAGFGYANRNVALAEAVGELIGFMAHDDLVLKDHFEVLVKEFDNPGVHLAHTSAAWVSIRGEVVPTVFHLEDAVMRQGLLEGTWNRVPATCFMHRREALQAVGMWNAAMARGGDMDLWGRIIQHYTAAAVRSVPRFTCLHFRANWRTAAHRCPDNEEAWVVLHRETGRLSSYLNIPTPAGMTEQQAAALWLSQEPGAAAGMEAGCVHALMTHAWELERARDGGAAQMRKLEETIAGQAAKLAEQEASIRSETALAEEIARLKPLAEELTRGRAAFEEAYLGGVKKIETLEKRRDDLIQQRDDLKYERDRLKSRIKALKEDVAKAQKPAWWKRWL